MMKKFLVVFLALCSLAAANQDRKMVGVIKFDCPSNSIIYVSIPLKSRNATDTWRFGDMNLQGQLRNGSSIYTHDLDEIGWGTFTKNVISGDWNNAALNQEFYRTGALGLRSRTNQMVFIAGYVPTEETTTVHLYPTNYTQLSHFDAIAAPPYPADIASFVGSDLAEQIPDLGEVNFYDGFGWQGYMKDPWEDDPWNPGAHEKSLPAGTAVLTVVDEGCDIIWRRPYQLGE